MPFAGWLHTVLAVPNFQHDIDIGSVYRICMSVGSVIAELIESMYASYGSVTQEKFAR
ncbi:hypothetical protein [Burkholderia oklahomensis]|uniref:Uncharacterized protein n=1 Tax=Burkholderia oklahomensis TaxID=342113 RepID=A0AAI8BAS7_9BURK|nr:hypothetical protein [Burkholderia oklahomensis]AIO68710.1 hypothetical protein DM82_5699 [Burkholderia oklahomensis]MBI0363179.1 hypothetical protein [Burkholderia oklahomensis]QPS40719.1 hypothetical protein I6G57_20580 [Burkholderia oklahomensis]SUY27291.1 Uncharacterised protein [Burkholderia oklahomensis]